MSERIPRIRVAAGDAATLDWIAGRGGAVTISNANLKAQRRYDRLVQKGWLSIEGERARFTPLGHRAWLSAREKSIIRSLK